MEWKKVRLESILALPSRNGLTKPSKIRGKGVKMIGMGELFANPIIYDIPMDRVPVTDKELFNSRIMPGDLLFARQSLTLEGAGKCCYVKEVKEETVFESHLIRIRIDKTKADAEFIYYFFNSFIGKCLIQNLVTQVAAAGIRGSELVKLEITIPKELEDQRRIASILSSLDRKIELNNKINADLEEMAQAIFKNWFVDFEPFKDGKFVDSELGMIPEGWRVGCLGDIAEITSGKRPPKKSKDKTKDLSIPLIGASDIMGFTSDVLYDRPILVIGRVGTHGVVQRFQEKCWPSDNTLVIESSYYNYIYQLLKGIDYSAINRGSTQPLITQTDVKNTDIILAPENVLKEYESITSTLFLKHRTNIKESTRLSLLRDTLLPRLMSGEIEVPE